MSFILSLFFTIFVGIIALGFLCLGIGLLCFMFSIFEDEWGVKNPFKELMLKIFGEVK